MFSATEAARFLDEAHRARARYQNLPEAIAPKNFDEAYAAQEALCALWEPRCGPIAGRKIAVTTKVMQELMGIDHPCGGTIFASRVHRSPARIAKADFVNVRVECELAVRLGRDLPKGAQAYTRETVRQAFGEVMAAFELIEDRHADYKACKALSLIADNAWNGGIVIGAAKSPPAGSDLNGIRGIMKRNGKDVKSDRQDR
jgi:2-keto-4-pentenoate hydratase